LKTLPIFLLVIFIIVNYLACVKKNPAQPQDDNEIPTLEGWTLIWNDEFKESSIDRGKWEHEVNGWGGGNNELQYYTDRAENSYIEDGSLVIKALKETYTGEDGTREYTSARLRTLNRGDWLYGRFDIRAKLPFGKGLWPAIWMLPTDWAYGGWAASGEIDIMELLGHEPSRVYGTIHYGGEYPNNLQSGGSYRLSNSTFADDFHLFTLEWDTTEFRWYVDGELYLTKDQWHTTNAPFPAPFNRRFHLLLNVAVGGNWPGNPDHTTVFPQMMYIDYVRVYRRSD
jgi:beta-glucanase (GH16 family)